MRMPLSVCRALALGLALCWGGVAPAAAAPPAAGLRLLPEEELGATLAPGSAMAGSGGAVAARRRAPRAASWRRAPGPEAYFSGELFLVQDKFMPALDLGFQFGALGADFEFGLLYLQQADRSGAVPGTWMGGLLGAHLWARALHGRRQDMRVGLGVDAFGLWAVHPDEWQVGMPLILEARFFLTPRWSAYLQARAYLLREEGLEPGVDRSGQRHAPLLLVAGLGGWR